MTLYKDSHGPDLGDTFSYITIDDSVVVSDESAGKAMAVTVEFR